MAQDINKKDESFIIDRMAVSQAELQNRAKLYELFAACPIPKDEILRNLGLFITRQSLSRILYIEHLYKKIINTHGIIIEFGVRWGQNLALFESLRGMLEPFNFKREIVGFDTFSGFENVDEKDGEGGILKKGAYSVTEGYENYLEQLLQCHEKESPISHIKKFNLIKGDASVTCKEYFDKNPHTIVALAYFDMDVYKPTYDCLNTIKDYLTKGSILAFDQFADRTFKGEIQAFKEVFNLKDFKIHRTPNNSDQAYIIID